MTFSELSSPQKFARYWNRCSTLEHADTMTPQINVFLIICDLNVPIWILDHVFHTQTSSENICNGKWVSVNIVHHGFREIFGAWVAQRSAWFSNSGTATNRWIHLENGSLTAYFMRLVWGHLAIVSPAWTMSELGSYLGFCAGQNACLQ